jgi:hypothetical protein
VFLAMRDRRYVLHGSTCARRVVIDEMAQCLDSAAEVSVVNLAELGVMGVRSEAR